MDNLQSTFEIVIDLGHFYNIDIFQRGLYYVSLEFEDQTSAKSNLEVHLLSDHDAKSLLPAKICKNKVISKTVQILHRHQDLALDHTFLFRCHTLIDCQSILANISEMKFKLVAKLWFSSSDDADQITLEDFDEVSNRTIQFQIDPIQGLHGYTLLVFEYGVRAGIELVIHASLVALHQPLLQTVAVCRNDTPGNVREITLESILFPVSKQPFTNLAKQLDYAISVHNSVIDILFSVYTYLTGYLTVVSQYVPSQSKHTHQFTEALIKIKGMQESMKQAGSRDEVLDQANMNLASTCSYVLALWSDILKLVCLNRNIIGKLALLHHKQRIQRFQSCFFAVNNPRYLFDDQRSTSYNLFANEVRSSSYYNNLPPLFLDTLESDGISSPMCIVFEDKYDVDCFSVPVFQHSCNLTSSGSYPKLSHAKHVKANMPDQKAGSFSNVKLLSNGVDNPAIDFNFKCLSNLADQAVFPTGHAKFSSDIAAHTMEEPDDFPNFNSLLHGAGETSANSSCNFTGPGYTGRKTISGNMVESSGCNGDHPNNHTNACKNSNNPHETEKQSKNGEETDETAKQLDSNNAKVNKGDTEDDMLTLEAFLGECMDFNQLHDDVCEPSGADSIGQDADSDALDIMTFSDSTNTLLQKLEAKHAAEKSRLLGSLQFPGHLFSDLPFTIPLTPYFSYSKVKAKISKDSHLIVFCHGLDGNDGDMRVVKVFLQMGLEAILKSAGHSKSQISYLMSSANENDTYDDIQIMTNKLVDEILDYIRNSYFSKTHPKRISFIGHSLGGLLIRSAITSESLKHLRPRFHTFVSFCSPHLGTVLNSSAIVNTGLWLMRKFLKSPCLLQLACKEKKNFRDTFIYKLSAKQGLEFFKNILLIAFADDRYVPYQSARIEMCKAAFKDKALSAVYQEMVDNIMSPVLQNPKINLRRYHVVHPLPTSSTTDAIIGRAAHVAVLDSELFLEQFFLVAGLQYFI